MARQAQIRVPDFLLPGLAPPAELPPEVTVSVLTGDRRLDAAQHMPRPEDGSIAGAMNLLSQGTLLCLLAEEGDKKLLLVGFQRDVGMSGRRTVEVEVIHGDESLLLPLLTSLRQSLQTYRSRAEIVGRFTPSEAVLEAAGWLSYPLGPFKVFYMEPAS